MSYTKQEFKIGDVLPAAKVNEMQDAIVSLETSVEDGSVYSASKLTTARKINGIPFDGTQDITVALVAPATVEQEVNMANIRTDVNYTIVDGAEIIFKAPCDSCTVTGLKVYYPNSDGIIVNEVFAFKDAHGNDLTDLDTFKANAMVKVILNTTDKTAYIQNADTNAYLESRFDNIQTTSRATLSQAGWYRIAESAYGILFDLKVALFKGFGLHQPETHVVTATCNSAYGKCIIKSTDTVGNTHTLTKFRLTKDSAKCYAEIYLSKTSEDEVHVSITSNHIHGRGWKSITPTLTEETLDGVTVTTTYDIPANASPVTSVDLANYLPKTGGTVINGDKNTSIQVSNNVIPHIIGLDSSVSGNAGLYDYTNNKWVVKSNSSGNNTFDGTATGNLPLTGGTVTDDSRTPLRVSNSVGTKVAIGYFNNDTLLAEIGVNVNKPFFRKDGVETDILHLGNMADHVLPLSGGTITNSNQWYALTTENPTGVTATVRFKGSNGIMGSLGFYGADNPMFVKSDNTTRVSLHHDGNSAKVVVSSTPLTAEGSVRVW